MQWMNVFGLVMVAVIMIPNILFAMKCKDGFVNKWNSKSVETVEQIGRFGCFGFMIINIPGTWFGWWSDEAVGAKRNGIGAGHGIAGIQKGSTGSFLLREGMTVYHHGAETVLVWTRVLFEQYHI